MSVLYPDLSTDTMIANLDLNSPDMPEPPTPLESSPEHSPDQPHPLLMKIKSKITLDLQQEQLEILKAIEPKYDNKCKSLLTEC